MRLLLDTHILVWLMEDSARIGDPVHAQIQQAADEDRLSVSAITPWEIAMLVAKGMLRLGHDVADWLQAALVLPGNPPGTAFASHRRRQHAPSLGGSP